MPMKLGMLGMWHTHANGLVRQVAIRDDQAFELRQLGPRVLGRNSARRPRQLFLRVGEQARVCGLAQRGASVEADLARLNRRAD